VFCELPKFPKVSQSFSSSRVFEVSSPLGFYDGARAGGQAVVFGEILESSQPSEFFPVDSHANKLLLEEYEIQGSQSVLISLRWPAVILDDIAASWPLTINYDNIQLSHGSYLFFYGNRETSSIRFSSRLNAGADRARVVINYPR